MQDAIRQAIATFPQKTVTVLGDLMLDVYEYGVVARLSPEAPVPVVRMEQRLPLPGGAANAARNAGACGARVMLFGVVGDDAAGRELLDLIGRDSIATQGIFTDPSRPTTEKKRIVGPEGHMLRVDYESVAAISDALSDRIATALAAALPDASALVIADYAKGVMSPRLAETAIALARAAGIPVVVDTKPAHADFYAAPTVLTPNAQEARTMAGTDDLTAAGAALVRRFSAPVIVTRGAEGMSLFSNAPPLHLPAVAVKVADVSGAGDTVTVGVALGLAAGLDLAGAMRLANFMAAVAVSKKGTAAVSAAELLKALA
jgi:D-beta-D-heptose 7-phosphate kinase/D-beta-D-heptose 1-phosphate adenosyltransferase